MFNKTIYVKLTVLLLTHITVSQLQLKPSEAVLHIKSQTAGINDELFHEEDESPRSITFMEEAETFTLTGLRDNSTVEQPYNMSFLYLKFSYVVDDKEFVFESAYIGESKMQSAMNKGIHIKGKCFNVDFDLGHFKIDVKTMEKKFEGLNVSGNSVFNADVDMEKADENESDLQLCSGEQLEKMQELDPSGFDDNNQVDVNLEDEVVVTMVIYGDRRLLI